MADVTTQLETALTAIQAAQADVASQAPSTGDTVLEAITPVLVAAGWTEPVVPATNPDGTPVNTTTDSTDVPVTTDTPPAA